METLNTRTQEFVGTIRKCPNCGAELPGMVAVCPQCGHEISGVGANVSVREFFDNYQKEHDDRRKLDMINNYPIPNTKEDLLEFALLASQQVKSFFDTEASKITSSSIYDSMNSMNLHGGVLGMLKTSFVGDKAGKVSVNDFLFAWKNKLDQIKIKANIVLSNNKTALQQINDILEETEKANLAFKMKKEKEEKSKKIKKIKSTILSVLAALFVVGLLVYEFKVWLPNIEADTNRPIEQETSRLESLQQEILTDINNGDYAAADLKIPELRWNYSPSSHKENVQMWSEKREALEKQLDSKRKEN